MSTVNNSPVRTYDIANSIVLSSTGTAVRTGAAIRASEVMLEAGGTGWIRFGDGTVTATVGAGSMRINAGERLHMVFPTGSFISWISAGGTADLVIVRTMP